MVIHVVRPGDTPYNLAREYGVPLSFLLTDNGLEPSDTLVVGQALVIQFPERTHTVRPGETLDAIARQYGVSLRQLYRNNPILGGRPLLYPDQDALNLLFRRLPLHWLGERFNYQLHVAGRWLLPPDQLEGSLLHFCGRKPWCEPLCPSALGHLENYRFLEQCCFEK